MFLSNKYKFLQPNCFFGDMESEKPKAYFRNNLQWLMPILIPQSASQSCPNEKGDIVNKATFDFLMLQVYSPLSLHFGDFPLVLSIYENSHTHS